MLKPSLDCGFAWACTPIIFFVMDMPMPVGFKHSEETKRKIGIRHKGKIVSEETKKKTSESMKGDKNHFFGKHHTIESNIKNSIAHIGKIGYWRGKKKPYHLGGGNHLTENGLKTLSKNMEERWKNKEYISYMRPILLNNFLNKRTSFTKPEIKFQDLCNKYKLPYKYTGNGAFWIENINPDFVNTNGQKICVEIWGDYWHNLPRMVIKDKKKLETLKKYGWTRIELWEYEINKLPESEIVLKVNNHIQTGD